MWQMVYYRCLCDSGLYNLLTWATANQNDRSQQPDQSETSVRTYADYDMMEQKILESKNICDIYLAFFTDLPQKCVEKH